LPDITEWWERVDVSRLSEDARYRILEYVVERFGKKKVLEETGISRVTLWRLLERVSPVKPEYVRPLLKLLTREEFESLVSVGERLRALGVVREDGTIDYQLALEVLALARRDEYLRSALLRFVVQEFREDLKRMLGASFSGVVLKWDEGFEHFLVERKKRRKVKDPETLKYYRNLFKEHLEGRELSEQLINYVVNHPNKWLRNVFRHYVQYLYYRRVISPETFGWLMEVVPSRSYRLDVRTYPINLEDVSKTLATLREEHELYYLIYRLMLEGGLRLSHATHVVKTFNSEEVVEVPGVDLETERLICFYNKGFCRYYVGLRESQKPCEWAYFSVETLELLREYAGSKVGRRPLEKFVKRRNLLLPKYVRKVAWRLMIRVMPREVARFIQSRFGELKVSEARYEDLLSEADENYPKYLDILRQLI